LDQGRLLARFALDMPSVSAFLLLSVAWVVSADVGRGADAVGANSGPPGTQTILLVKGGYGVGANLLASSTRTTHLSQLLGSQAPPAGETTEAMAILKATKTASELTQDLQSAVHSAMQTEEKAKEEHLKVTQLSGKLTDNEQKMKSMEGVMKQNEALQKQVSALTKELEKAKVQAVKEEKVNKALMAKSKDLEQDIKVSNKAWDIAAEDSEVPAVKKSTKKPSAQAAKKSTKRAAKPIAAKKAVVAKVATKVAAPVKKIAAHKAVAAVAKEDKEDAADADVDAEDDEAKDATETEADGEEEHAKDDDSSADDTESAAQDTEPAADESDETDSDSKTDVDA